MSGLHKKTAFAMLLAACLSAALAGCSGCSKERNTVPEAGSETTEEKKENDPAKPAVTVTAVPTREPTVTAAAPTPKPTAAAMTPKPTTTAVPTPKPTAAPGAGSSGSSAADPTVCPVPVASPAAVPAEIPAAVPSVSSDTAPAHVHSWEPVTETVHHEAVTEQNWVVDREAWDEPVYEEQPVYELHATGVRCGGCGSVFADEAAWTEHSKYHALEQEDYSHGSYTAILENVQVGTQIVQTGTRHHSEEGRWETRVITEAYDETVVTGYRCTGCGAVK